MTSFPVDVVAELTLNWSDDFNDGNYDGWNVTAGSYAVTGGKLTVTALAPGPAMPVILHPSNTTFGNWTFDIEIGDDPDADPDNVVFSFMRNFGGSLPWASGITENVAIWVQFLGNGMFLGRNTNDLDTVTILAEWEHHIRVQRTRAEPTKIRIYHNDTLALETALIVPVTNYSYVSFCATRGSSIDNINVEYEPEPEPPTTPTTPTTPTETTNTGSAEPPDMTMILMIAGGGAVVVVIIAIVVKMRS